MHITEHDKDHHIQFSDCLCKVNIIIIFLTHRIQYKITEAVKYEKKEWRSMVQYGSPDQWLGTLVLSF